MKTAQCLAADSAHRGPVIATVDGYDVIECEACGFRHIDPLFTDEELKKFYDGEFYEKERPDYFDRMEADKEWWMLRYHHYFGLLEAHAPVSDNNRRRILDIGSGPGYFLEAGRERGWQVLGFEPSSIAADYTRSRGLAVINDFFSAAKAKEHGPFDAISLSMVLEHVRDPIGLIDEARSLLVPGGLLLLISPNDFNPLQMTLWKQLGFQPWWVNPKHHLNYFDTGSAGRFLKARRFEVLHLETSYPLENFLLAGRNYVGNPTLGRECHNERKAFESVLFRHDKPRMEALAASWAAQGIGREFIILGEETVKIVGLVQAHYLGWAGAQDLSLARVGGKYAVEEVIDRLQAMKQIDSVTVAVPDDPGNEIFREIAAARGADCFFGSRENVLARVTAALDSADADVAVHVMGQHCFVDTALLADMLEFMRESHAKFVSLPDAFTPYFAGKIYSRALLDEVGAAIRALPGDQAVHFARYAAFIEQNRARFSALVYEKLPQYDRDYLLRVRDLAREIFSDDRMHVDATQASKISNPLFESYEFARSQFGANDRVLDIACGDGYGCRIMAGNVGAVLGVDINQPLIAANQQNNAAANISYDAGDCFALSLPDGSVTGATAMEFIEHIPVDQVDNFVKEVRRVVAPGGSFVCSTPQNSHGDIPVVPWHVKEYSAPELRAILERHFSSVKILSSKSGGRLTESETGQKMVALCR